MRPTITLVVVFTLTCTACPRAPRHGPARPTAGDTKSAASQQLDRIQQRLLAAKKSGGTPSLAKVLGPLAKGLIPKGQCPEHLLVSHPVWRSPKRLPGASRVAPVAALLFFAIPQAVPPREAPAKKDAAAREIPVVLTVISATPDGRKLERRCPGSPFGTAVPKARWLEFPPGHALVEIQSRQQRAADHNETVNEGLTMVLGFPAGRPTTLAEVRVDTERDDATTRSTEGKYYLIKHQGRYFLVTEELTQMDSNVQSPYASPGPRPPGEWARSYTIAELDARTQIARELKGAALKQALTLPPLKGFVPKKGRGTPDPR